MKKLLLLAVCFVMSALQAQAQPYLKQVITFSLTGKKGPETEVTTASSRTYKPLTFKITDKDLCWIIALENGISLKNPQLVKIYDSVGQTIGHYVMDAGKVVADANDYFARDRDVAVYSQTDSRNSRTGLWTTSFTSYTHDSWTMGSLSVVGMNTSTVKFTSYHTDDGAVSYSTLNFSAVVAGAYGTMDSDSYAVCTGTVKATSGVIKTAILGL